MSAAKFDERAYPVVEQDDEQMAREQYEQDQMEEDDGNRA